MSATLSASWMNSLHVIRHHIKNTVDGGVVMLECLYLKKKLLQGEVIIE